MANSFRQDFAGLRSRVIAAVRELATREEAEIDVLNHEIRKLVDDLELLTRPVPTGQAATTSESLVLSDRLRRPDADINKRPSKYTAQLVEQQEANKGEPEKPDQDEEEQQVGQEISHSKIPGSRRGRRRPDIGTKTSIYGEKRRRTSCDPRAEGEMTKVKKTLLHKTPRKHATHQIRGWKDNYAKGILKAPASLFREFVKIPSRIIQPDNLYKLLANRIEEKYHDVLPLLTRLFFAIASPDAFDQLCEACSSVRQEQTLASTISIDESMPPMQSLDQLGTATSISATLRRFHLTRLLDRRISLGNSHKTASPITRQCKSIRADTQALADLMAESYPHLERPTHDKFVSTGTEYQVKLRKLQNRLSCARNWYTLQQKFSPGILALVPYGGDFQIQIDQVERLSNHVFSAFLEMLIEQRGGFLFKVGQSVSHHIQNILHRKDLRLKYAFETVDKMLLKQEPLDSPEFLRLAGLSNDHGVTDLD